MTKTCNKCNTEKPLDEFHKHEGLEDRQWAYIEDGKLPEEFDGGEKVPKRFHEEVERYTKQKGKLR